MLGAGNTVEEHAVDGRRTLGNSAIGDLRRIEHDEPRQIEAMRAEHPGIRVIVHPETPWEVVQAADDAGSTEYIIRTVKEPFIRLWSEWLRTG